MNYSSQYCILNINLILIMNLHPITIISKDNPVIHGKLFFHLLTDIVMLLNFHADINRIFVYSELSSFQNAFNSYCSVCYN